MFFLHRIFKEILHWISDVFCIEILLEISCFLSFSRKTWNLKIVRIHRKNHSILACRTLQQQPLFENAVSKNVTKITPKKLWKFMEKVMKIHLVFCILFESNFTWILTSFLHHFGIEIIENPLPTGLREINEFRGSNFPHFWWILSRFGVPRPRRKSTICHKNATFDLEMEMSRPLWVVFNDLAGFLLIFQ